MATIYGANATLRQNVPSEKIDSSDQGGRVRMIYDSYTSAGAIAINSILEMGDKVPAGARILDVWLNYTGASTVGTIEVGWAASADGGEAADENGFLAGQVVTTADCDKMSDVNAAVAGMGKKFSEPVQVQLDFTAASDAADTYELFVLYTLD